MAQVTMTVNGKAASGTVEGRTLLSSFLRETLDLTGTHVGCDTSQCGACVVHVKYNPTSVSGPPWFAVWVLYPGYGDDDCGFVERQS